ncbi:MAG: CBS domain-containing protein [Anaerolineales bacterium]|jgi:CBS domain-containing protein
MELQPLVQDWMSADPITADIDLPIMEAHRLMTDNGIRRLPVIDRGRLAGIVTLGDVRGAEPSEATSLSIWELNYLLSKLTVERVMSSPVISVRPEDPVSEAARLMLTEKIAGLPVLEGDDLVGIITESDIFRMVVHHWQRTPAAAPSL